VTVEWLERPDQSRGGSPPPARPPIGRREPPPPALIGGGGGPEKLEGVQPPESGELSAKKPTVLFVATKSQYSAKTIDEFYRARNFS